MRFRQNLIVSLTSILAVTTARAQNQIVRNGGMESGQGAGAIDPHVPDKWTTFGVNIERSDQYNLLPVGAGHALKAFGDGNSTSVGAFQEITNVTAGQSVTASVKLFSPANDKLRGSGQAGLIVEFLNQFGGGIGGTHDVYVLDVNSESDTWITASFGPFTAPANTAKVRITCRLQWSLGDVLGAAYWDDARVTINGGPNKVLNGDFESAGHSTGQSSVGIDEWTGFNDQEKSGDAHHDGLFSLKLGTREGYSGLYQDMDVLNAGEHLVMTAYVWNPATDPLTADSRAGIKLEFNPNGNVPPPQENLAFDQNDDPDLWTLVQLNTTVPAQVTIARVVYIFVGDSQTSGAVYYDSAFAERGSAIGVNQLQNAGFESGTGGPNGINNWTEFNGGGSSQAQKSCFDLGSYHDGICAVRATGQAVSGVFQEIAVTPGESLSVRAYLQTPSFEQLAGTGTAGVKIEWVIGGVPEGVDIGQPGGPNTIGAGAPTDTWIPLTIDYTMPPGSSAVARFTNIIEKGTALSGRAYFDTCAAVVLNRCSPCDTNCDGSVNQFDIQPFVNILSGAGSPCSGCAADANGDGSINQFDIQGFVECLTN